MFVGREDSPLAKAMEVHILHSYLSVGNLKSKSPQSRKMYIWHLQHKTTGGVEAIYAENQDKVGQFPRSQLRAESSLVARKNARFGL